MGTRLKFRPLTPDRWDDLEDLFGPRGACSGCWCMWWRCTRRQFDLNGNEGNRRAFRKIVSQGSPPGILAYAADRAVGWCSVAPRESYPSVMRSRVLKPADAQPAWAVTCLFVARDWRGRRMSEALVRASVDYVRERGGRLVEAYPTDPRGKRLAAVSSYMGTPAIFRAAGFREFSRPSPARVIMRRQLRPRRSR
ncbi:MAG: GNAT family N-acetyltransferase [Gammaproteobacteria bacterium]